MTKTRKMKDFKLPEYWYIVVTNENLAMIDKWKKTTKCPRSARNWCYVVQNGAGDMIERGVKISDEQFKKYVLKEDDMEIIGYKLKEEFKAYSTLAFRICTGRDNLKGIIGNVLASSDIEKLNKARVLDIWFEPIYKYKYSLPKINGYEGKISGNTITYGCAALNIPTLKELLCVSAELGNRSIKSITLSSDVTITMDEVKQIVEYFDNI